MFLPSRSNKGKQGGPLKNGISFVFLLFGLLLISKKK